MRLPFRLLPIFIKIRVEKITVEVRVRHLIDCLDSRARSVPDLLGDSEDRRRA